MTSQILKYVLFAVLAVFINEFTHGTTINDNFDSGELSGWRTFARSTSGVVDSTLGVTLLQDGKLALGTDTTNTIYRAAVVKTFTPISGKVFFSFVVSADRQTTRNFVTLRDSSDSIVARISIGKCRIGPGNEVNNNIAITTSMQNGNLLPDTEIIVGSDLFTKKTDIQFTIELNTETDSLTVKINDTEYPEATGVPFINSTDNIQSIEFWQYYTYNHLDYLWIDNVFLSDIDKGSLVTAIANVQNFLDMAVSGDTAGSYPDTVLTELNDSLQVAIQINDTSISQERIDTITATLTTMLKEAHWSEIMAEVSYKANLVEVIGDTKQAFINSKVNNKSQLDYLLLGFRKMHVTGIRVPIFAKDSIPNPELLDYFITEATNRGFKIFANPALYNGAQRIANGVLFDKNKGGSVKGNSVKTDALIERIKEFAANNQCTWIAPFNEDGRPNGTWTTSQINTIFSQLKDSLNGAELIGPCPWGIDAGIELLEQTNVRDYIGVSTTHNLGFNHGLWNSFISLSKENSLPVWDSEATHNAKEVNGVWKESRLVVAIEKGVDGVVLYNSWQAINMSSGELLPTGNGEALMAEYIADTGSTSSNDIITTNNKPLIYPNPANRIVRVKGLENVSGVSYALYNLAGNTIDKGMLNSTNTINLTQYPSGMYLVEFSYNEHRHVLKLLIE